MTPRCPERIAVGRAYARCHRPPQHPGPCHAAGRSWYTAGDAGQRLRVGVPCFPDCLPMPGPSKRPGQRQRQATAGRGTKRRGKARR